MKNVHRIAFSLVCSALFASVSLAETDVASVATKVLGDIRGSAGSCPPSWANAKVGRVEKLASGDRHLAQISAGGQEAGYILLLQQGDTFVPVMYSGSRFPDYMPDKLAANVPGSFAPPTAGPMPSTMLVKRPESKDSRVKVSSLACCLASVFLELQTEQRVPCFYKRYKQWGEFDAEPRLILPHPKHEPGELAEFSKKRTQIYSDQNLYEPVATAPGAPWDGLRRPKDKYVLFDRVQALIRSELQGEWSLESRWSLMGEEDLAAAARLDPPLPTPGQICAFIMQTYLDDSKDVNDGCARFVRSRGLKLNLVSGRLDAGLRDKLPCVAVPSNKSAMVVLAVEQSLEPHWVLVWTPENAVLHDRSPAKVAAPDESHQARSELSNNLKKSIEEAESRLSPEEKKRIAERRAARAASPVTPSLKVYEDTKASDPNVLACGAHWVRAESIQEMQVFWISGE